VSAALQPTLLRQFIKPLGLVAVLVVAGVVLKLLAASLHDSQLQTYVAHHGAIGYLAFVGAGALLTATGIPRQAVAFAGGYALGLEWGIALTLLAEAMGCALDFFFARIFARDWTQRRLGARLAKIDRKLCAEPFTASLVLRLLPIGNNTVLGLLAGVSSIKPLPFLAGSIIGYVPQTVIFGLLGSGVEVSHDKQVAVAAVLFLVSGALGAYLLKRSNSS
jgi:uncharacterized membrane protein YdjX (TVP38/TMEM64 family)